MEYFGFLLLLIILAALLYVWAMMPNTDRRDKARKYKGDCLRFSDGDLTEFLSECEENGYIPILPVTKTRDNRIAVSCTDCENMDISDLTKKGIYTLEGALEKIPADKRVMIEVKSSHKEFHEGKLLIHAIREARRTVAVVSEDVFPLSYLAKEENSILRGAAAYGNKGSYFLGNFRCRPDFIICDRECNTLSAALVKSVFRVPVLHPVSKENNNG